jgi:hypothetical protein
MGGDAQIMLPRNAHMHISGPSEPEHPGMRSSNYLNERAVIWGQWSEGRRSGDNISIGIIRIIGLRHIAMGRLTASHSICSSTGWKRCKGGHRPREPSRYALNTMHVLAFRPADTAICLDS